jgi:hypothetical protein
MREVERPEPPGFAFRPALGRNSGSKFNSGVMVTGRDRDEFSPMKPQPKHDEINHHAYHF